MDAHINWLLTPGTYSILGARFLWILLCVKFNLLLVPHQFGFVTMLHLLELQRNRVLRGEYSGVIGWFSTPGCLGNSQQEKDVF